MVRYRKKGRKEKKKGKVKQKYVKKIIYIKG